MNLNRIEEKTSMISRVQQLCLRVSATVAFVLICVGLVHAEPLKVSKFAPIEDLTGQIEYYIESLERSVNVEAADYVEAKQATVEKGANTLAALVLLAGNHDQETPLKAAAPAMLAAAKALAASAKDLQKSKDNVAAIKQAASGGGPGGAIGWSQVAEVDQLMKQVSTLNGRLKRGVSSSRLKKYAKRTTGYSVTMAAIAQAASADDSYAEDAGQLKQWNQFCAEMRDAAGAVNAAIHKQDAKAVAAAMTSLKNSCDRCHKVFEIDEEP
ncbi:MAG: hypothetical protein VB853_00795 [Pirellulales bacterium]